MYFSDSYMPHVPEGGTTQVEHAEASFLGDGLREEDFACTGGRAGLEAYNREPVIWWDLSTLNLN
jgi:hypothetical protein